MLFLQKAYLQSEFNRTSTKLCNSRRVLFALNKQQVYYDKQKVIHANKA